MAYPMSGTHHQIAMRGPSKGRHMAQADPYKKGQQLGREEEEEGVFSTTVFAAG